MISSKSEYHRYLEADALHMKKCEGIKERIVGLIAPDYIRTFLRLLRRLEYLTNCPTPFNRLSWIITKVRYRRLSVKLGFSIPLNVIGPGLSLPHYGMIVISPHARIGANCRIHSGVNIGASAGGSKAPEIGDNVYIGPGAVIFGDIKLAGDITIGANATVNRSFDEPNTVVAGNPAIVVKRGVPSWQNIIHKGEDKRLSPPI